MNGRDSSALDPLLAPSITDRTLYDNLARRMRAASRVELIYGKGAPLRGFSRFGISAVLDAAERELMTRRE